MKRIGRVILTAAFLLSSGAAGITSVYAYPDSPHGSQYDQNWQHRDSAQQRDYGNRQEGSVPSHGPNWSQNRNEGWQQNHENQWLAHEQEWTEHDREWREHEGDRHWQEEHAHEWNDWYRWHHDNGDEGFNDFIFGILFGTVLGGVIR